MWSFSEEVNRTEKKTVLIENNKKHQKYAIKGLLKKIVMKKADSVSDIPLYYCVKKKKDKTINPAPSLSSVGWQTDQAQTPTTN